MNKKMLLSGILLWFGGLILINNEYTIPAILLFIISGILMWESLQQIIKDIILDKKLVLSGILLWLVGLILISNEYTIPALILFIISGILLWKSHQKTIK